MDLCAKSLSRVTPKKNIERQSADHGGEARGSSMVVRSNVVMTPAKGDDLKGHSSREQCHWGQVVTKDNHNLDFRYTRSHAFRHAPTKQECYFF